MSFNAIRKKKNPNLQYLHFHPFEQLPSRGRFDTKMGNYNQYSEELSEVNLVQKIYSNNDFDPN